jgi:hypothetical protein
MEKEFVIYPLALKMKQLGFDEPCLACYYNAGEKLDIDEYVRHGQYTVLAPLFQQAFRWFRENYNLFCEINIDKTMEPKFAYTIMEYESAQFFEGFNEDILSEYLYYKHEEAELACLEKLIEIVESNGKEEML